MADLGFWALAIYVVRSKLPMSVKQTVEIEGHIINGELVLVQPSGMTSDLYVQNNQIVIGEQRIIVRLLS